MRHQLHAQGDGAVAADGALSGARRHAIGVVALAALAAALTLPGAASGAGADTPVVGTLTYLGCIEQAGGPDDCATTGIGLGGPTGLEAAPDGVALYVAGGDEEALTPLRRSADGSLTALPCIQGAPASECQRTAVGLVDDPDALAVAPNSAQVYGGSAFNVGVGSLAILQRAGDGTLLDGGCFYSFEDRCGPGATRTVAGLMGPSDVAVSPDGENVYVTTGSGSSGAGDGTVVSFGRAPNGDLTPLGCIADEGNSVCGSANTTPGLAGASGIAVSPDGDHVYVSTFSPDGDPDTAGATGAVIAFERGANGTLTPIGCLAQTGSAVCGAGNSAPGLRGASDVAISADGETVYVASANFRFSAPTLDGDDAAVAAFRRNADGTLAPLGCVAQTGSGECGGAAMEGLRGARELALSADGHDLYVAGRGGTASDQPGALAQLIRGADGGLTPAGCFSEPGSTICGGDRALPGLRDPFAVAITPDDRGVYVAGLLSDAVAGFRRAVQPPSGGPPSNQFSFGKLKKNKKKGTAKLTVRVPGPGELDLAKTKKLKRAAKQPQAAGNVKLKVKSRGKAKRKLSAKRLRKSGKKRLKVRVKAEVTYTPDGGTPNTQTKPLKLVKR